MNLAKKEKEKFYMQVSKHAIYSAFTIIFKSLEEDRKFLRCLLSCLMLSLCKSWF